MLKGTKLKKKKMEELCANKRSGIETYNFDFIAQVPQLQDRDATALIMG